MLIWELKMNSIPLISWKYICKKAASKLISTLNSTHHKGKTFARKKMLILKVKIKINFSATGFLHVFPSNQKKSIEFVSDGHGQIFLSTLYVLYTMG